MADPTCPECRGKAIVSTDNRLYCQGAAWATDDYVAELDRTVKEAIGMGTMTPALDRSWRIALAARSCGKVSIPDGKGGWKLPVNTLEQRNIMPPDMNHSV